VDTEDVAVHLAADLVRKLGSDQVFFDKRSIEAGDDYPVELRFALDSARVVLVLIGPQWLLAQDKYGQRRLDIVNDWVRLEIADALAHSAVVIPVLVNEARPIEKPALSNLPDISALSNLQGSRLRGADWDRDVGNLLGKLESEGFARVSNGTHAIDQPPMLSDVPSRKRVPNELLIGSGIKRLREAIGLNQKQLAEESGVTLNTVELVERDEGKTSAEAFDKLLGPLNADRNRLDYEARVHDIVLKTIRDCEALGLPVAEIVLNRGVEKGSEIPNFGDPSLQAALLLETEIATSVASGITPIGFVAPIFERLAENATYDKCTALTRFLGSLAISLVEPLSIDLEQSVIRMSGVGEGLGVHIVLNGHRGTSVSVPFLRETSDQGETSHQLPQLLEPGCAFRVAAPESAQDHDSVKRTLLVQINSKYPFLDSAQGPIDSGANLDLDDAFLRAEVLFEEQAEKDDAIFAYSLGSDSDYDFIKSLVMSEGGMTSLRAVHVDDETERASLRLDPIKFEAFLQRCLRSVSERLRELSTFENKD